MAKTKSAPGADGFSNKFIQKFWKYFRTPLFKLGINCYESGNLTSNFKGANIKLIPKKGNLSQLKNWRPISLLNCFYKIISRAICARLKKVMDKLTPIAQKGYSKTRRCQEALIEIIEGIVKKTKRGALLSLDIRKAFDTLSHSFVEKVLEHFNFGVNFKKWITLLCTNREACIVLEGGKLSRRFKLLRGNAQGDILSTFVFLLCYQILLFKLQFDLQIKSFVSSPTVTPGSPDVHLPDEVSNTPTKVAAMADDASCLVLMDPATLGKIKEVLAQFGEIQYLAYAVT